MAYRCSTVFVKWINVLTLVLGVVLLVTAGVLYSKQPTACLAFIQTPLIVLGSLVTVVSLLGLLGTACTSSFLLWIYMVLLSVITLVFLAFTIFSPLFIHHSTSFLVHTISLPLMYAGATHGSCFRSIPPLFLQYLPSPVSLRTCVFQQYYLDSYSKWMQSTFLALPCPVWSRLLALAQSLKAPPFPYPSPLSFPTPPLMAVLRQLRNSGTWERVQACMVDAAYCQQLNLRYPDLSQYHAAQLSPTESGCCRPPIECGYRQMTATIFMQEAPPHSDNPDCTKYSAVNSTMCFACDSCRAGVAEYVKTEWMKVAYLLLAFTIILMSICVFGCCATYHVEVEEEEPLELEMLAKPSRHKSRRRKTWA
ncbi:unnamed protein product [Closterium sp. NIES-65]|nr:unnamed protein product [Closterium sp. NIES-65]